MARGGRVPAQDTGWAWVVLLAAFLGSNLTGFFGVTGLFHLMFLDVFQKPPTTTALVNTLNYALFNLTAPIGGILMRVFSPRVVIMASGFLTACGCFLTCFANSLTYAILTFGILIGTSFGIAYTTIIVQPAHYFTRYRTLAYGVFNMGVGTGAFIYAYLLEELMVGFGWRGAIMVISGLLLNLCVVGAIMRPVGTQTSCNGPSGDVSHSTEKCGVRKYFDIQVLRNGAFLLQCLNLILITIALSSVSLYFPASVMDHGANFAESSILVSAYAIASTASRLLTGLVTTYKKVSKLGVYVASNLLAGAALFSGPSLLGNDAGRISFIVVYSFFANSFCSLMTPLAVDFVGINHVETAVGLQLTASGLAYLVGPPMMGCCFVLGGLAAASTRLLTAKPTEIVLLVESPDDAKN